MKILGIDPGLGRCGFGLIETGSATKALDYGVVTTTVDAPLPSRLLELYDSLKEVFDECKPEMVAVEKLFFAKNITTGIAVAEARGIVLLVAEQKGLPVYEYTPNEIKKSLIASQITSLLFKLFFIVVFKDSNFDITFSFNPLCSDQDC